MIYLAIFEQTASSAYLTKDSQIEEYLKKGANIYRGEDEEHMERIATPEDGLLVERPVFPVSVTVSIR